MAEVFDERAALMPLPSTAFDPVRWGKPGRPTSTGWSTSTEPVPRRPRFGAFWYWPRSVGHGQLTPPATGELFAEHPRQYGRSRNVEDPAPVLPRPAVKPPRVAGKPRSARTCLTIYARGLIPWTKRR